MAVSLSYGHLVRRRGGGYAYVTTVPDQICLPPFRAAEGCRHVSWTKLQIKGVTLQWSGTCASVYVPAGNLGAIERVE